MPNKRSNTYFLLPSTSLARPSRSLSERTKPVFSSCSHRVELVHRPSRHLPSGHHLLLNPLTPPRLSPRTYTLSSMNLYLPPLCSMLGVGGCVVSIMPQPKVIVHPTPPYPYCLHQQSLMDLELVKKTKNNREAKAPTQNFQEYSLRLCPFTSPQLILMHSIICKLLGSG